MSQAILELAKQGYSTQATCHAFGLPRATYYRSLSVTEPATTNAALREQIQQVALEWSCFGMVLLWLPPHYKRAASARC